MPNAYYKHLDAYKFMRHKQNAACYSNLVSQGLPVGSHNQFVVFIILIEAPVQSG